jgi:hypothetical protein
MLLVPYLQEIWILWSQAKFHLTLLVKKHLIGSDITKVPRTPVLSLLALTSLRELDVNKYFSEYHRLNAQMHILGSKFSPQLLYITLKNRFDQPPFKDIVREFGRRAFRNDVIDEMFIADFVESLKFEASHLPGKPMEANFVKRKVKCGLCMKNNRIQTTSFHSDKDCRFGDVPGFPEKSRHNKRKSD